MDGPLVPKPTINELIANTFVPILECAGATAQQFSLTTEGLPPDDLQHQSPIVNSMKFESRPLALGGGAPYLRSSYENRNYYFIGTDSLSIDEVKLLDETMGAAGFTREEFLPCHFLLARFHLNDFYKLKSEYRRRDYCADILSPAKENDYTGHRFVDLIELFQSISLYSIDCDATEYQSSPWILPVYITSQIRSLRSDIVGERLNNELINLSKHTHGDVENIYNSLTSTHHSQIFLEIYRYYENVFSLPWGIALKSNFNLGGVAVPIALDCRRQLKWRAKEDESIKGLFSMVGYELLQELSFNKIELFKDINNSDSEPMAKAAAVGRRLYKIRNILVHKEDFEDTNPIEPREVIDDELLVAFCKLAAEIYKNYHNDIFSADIAA
jgi:hypothetical protein